MTSFRVAWGQLIAGLMHMAALIPGTLLRVATFHKRVETFHKPKLELLSKQLLYFIEGDR